MRSRANNPFTTVTTAGLLLPVDLLTRLIEGDPDLKGLSPKDYHLRSSERLNEAAARAWNECLACWKTFRKKFAALPASDAGTTATRDEWLLPLFQELGYGRLQAKKAIEIEGREYPISHGWENHVPIHLLSARYPLDRRTPGVSGAATRAPYSLLQEMLNRSAQHRWGFVSNGLTLFLLRDNAALARAANVEFDLEAMMDGEIYSDFMLLFLLCHQSRVEILGSRGGDEESERANPEDCWLEKWANLADTQGTRAREKLRDGVEAAIKALGAGFLTTKGNNTLRERLRTGELPTQDYYRQLLRVVYRLLMLLVAEEKKSENGPNLLHPPDTPPEVRDRCARFYSVGRIRSLAYERRGTAHTDLYESLKVLFLKLREGYAPLGIPGMGSFLFSDDSTPDLDQALLANRDLLDAFRQLCYTEDTSGRGGSVRRPVDFGNLGSEELGSVYESLLELHPEIDSGVGPFTLGTAAGHERKTTGSYYTPRSLINCLLDSALDPVVNEAIDVPDPAEAEQKLLDLKVCDPACGSGHFLIAAAERMATHLARLRTGDDQPNTLDVQHAKRDIIGRCIYGVDMNPMAVELCKVSLWMEALEPGKPLSFLDHHIQCGNSLLGATPRLLAEGIPDDAFKPIEGDEKAFCSELKKQNKKERQDRRRGQSRFRYEPSIPMSELPQRLAAANALPDGTLAELDRKKEATRRVYDSPKMAHARFLADAWCAAFVWKKTKDALGKQCPSDDFLFTVARDKHHALPHVAAEIDHLRDEYQFFHWHLAFLHIFPVPPSDEFPENEQTGWNGGFDVVLGNPPWERLKIQEKEWFAERDPEIARAQNTASRRKLIAKRQEENDPIYFEFREALRNAAGEAHIARSSNRFPLTARGDLNTYPLFVDLGRQIIGPNGHLGIIVPCGIATDSSTQHLFKDLCKSESLVALFGFINEEMLFPEVLHNFKFCLLIVGGSSINTVAPDFVFNCYNLQHLADKVRHFSLRADDIQLLNPNTNTCPVFFWAKSAEVTKEIYRRIPILERENSTNPWNITYSTMFHMSSDSNYFELESTEDSTRLYEAKMMHQFNHRFASYEHLARGERSHMLPENEGYKLADPDYTVTPCYFVPKSVVRQRLARRTPSTWQLGYREITSAGLYRTTIYSVFPECGLSNKIPTASFSVEQLNYAPSFFACMNSFALDFCARQKLGGASFSFFIKKQLPVVPPSAYDSDLISELPLNDWIRARVLELTNTAWDLEAFALDCGYDGPPFRWDEERRFQIRCELDAAYFHLYLGSEEEWGADNPQLREMFPTPRDAVDYIMDTFPIVRRKDEAKHDGDYRTKRVILEIYDQMAEAIRTGEPYQTHLDPPPGPPADAEGHFIPSSEWSDVIRRQYANVIHMPTDKPMPKQLEKILQGEAILYLRLLLRERGKPVQRDVFDLDLCFALNPDLRRRVLLDEPVNESNRASKPPTAVLPRLREQLMALEKNEIVTMSINGRREFITLVDDADLDTPLCQSLLPVVREAIEATSKIFDTREEDAYSAEAFANLQPFLREGEIENFTSL